MFFKFGFLLLIVFTSCSVNRVTIHKAKREYDFIKETAEIILKNSYATRFETQKLSDLELKGRLEKIPCGWVDISFKDSTVTFCRWGNPIAVVELLYDCSKKEQTNSYEKNGWMQVKNKLYYRKRTWQIS